MRNYDDIVRRIDALNQPYIHRRILGQVEGYPIFCLTLSSNDGLPTILINAGTHGDEPTGVAAALVFLNQDHSSLLKAFRFEVIPCLNPYGYVHDTRHNRQDIDINRAFGKNDVLEVECFRHLINNRWFEGAIDLHEDWESPGYYMYERRRGAPCIGRELIRRVSTACPVNTNPCIEGAPAVEGVLQPVPDLETAPGEGRLSVVLFQQHTDHFITAETPTELPMAHRVEAHLITLNTIIENHADQNKMQDAKCT